jgi:outer membrane protein assembly factor BamB
VKARLAVAALAATLASCSMLGLGGDEAKKPMPLPEFKPSVTPKAAWTASVGKARDHRFFPEASGGRVYAAAEDGTISVLEEDTGRLVTRIDAKKKLSSGLDVESSTLVVGTLKGEVIALDPAGKVLWTAQVAGEVLAPATLVASTALVRTSDGRIFAFGLADGKRRWVYQRATPALLLRSEAGVVATSTNVVAGYPGGKLVALDLEDGKLTWEVTVALPRGATELERVADIAGLPVIDAGRICAAAFQGKVACFEITTGNTVWARDISSATGLSLEGPSVYLTDDKDNVHALDKATGASRWKQDKFLRRKLTSPVPFEGKVVVGDSLGYLHVLSPDDGAIQGRLALDGTAVRALVATRNGLLVQTAGGSLSLVRF